MGSVNPGGIRRTGKGGKTPTFNPSMNNKQDVPEQLIDENHPSYLQPESRRKRPRQESPSPEYREPSQPSPPTHQNLSPLHQSPADSNEPNDPERFQMNDDDPFRPATPRPDTPPLDPNEYNDDSSDDDLPRMPDTSSDESEPEENIEIIPNQSSRPSFDIIQRRGRPVRAKSHFMTGKYLRLAMTNGEDDDCALCNVHAPLATGQSEILSFQLEKLLWRNGLFSQRGDGFGISFERNGGVNGWQVICKDCLSYNGDQQDVIDDCFRLNFHQQHNNLNSSDDLRNIFNTTEYLTIEVIKDIRGVPNTYSIFTIFK